MFTRFMDMHSGGGCKESPYETIFIEAPESEAKVIFYNRFGHNPERISCTCCGGDYSIDESETLEQATGFDRGCHYAYVNKRTGKEIPESEGFIPRKGVKRGYVGKYVERQSERYSFREYQPLSEYLKTPSVLVIRAEEIKPEEREGDIPAQGYVWV